MTFTTNKTATELQLGDGLTIHAQQKEQIVSTKIIAQTTDIRGDGTITTRCTDQACLDTEHTHFDSGDYFHTSFLEQSDATNGLGERLWIITAERLSNSPEWAIHAQIQDDLTPDDSLACATAMLHASVRAGLHNGKGN